MSHRVFSILSTTATPPSADCGPVISARFCEWPEAREIVLVFFHVLQGLCLAPCLGREKDVGCGWSKHRSCTQDCDQCRQDCDIL